jgi:hypothetical protein
MFHVVFSFAAIKYLSFCIVHLIYAPTSPARTLRAYTQSVLILRYSFPYLGAGSSLRAAGRSFVFYPKYLAPLLFTVPTFAIKHNYIFHCGLRMRDLSRPHSRSHFEDSESKICS